MTEHVTRTVVAMRDAGRSWTEISDRTGLTVREAKSAADVGKRKRREGLARTPANEARRGLLDKCWYHVCKHNRKEHDEHGCRVCARTVDADSACDEFTEAPTREVVLPYRLGYPNDVGQKLAIAERRIVRVAWDGTAIRFPYVDASLPNGRTWLRRGAPEMPQRARPATRLRRLRRRGLA